MSEPAERLDVPDTSEIVDTVLGVARTRGLPAALAVERAWNRLTLPHPLLILFAKRGLAGAVNQALHDERGRTLEEAPDAAPRRGRAAQFRPHAAIYADSPLWQIAYDVGGELKPIARFTLEDCDLLLDKANSQVAGWKQVASTFRRAKGLLTKHGVSSVYELPEQAFRSLEP